MPYCSKCGKAISDGDEFCKSCGNSLKDETSIKSKDDVDQPQTSQPTSITPPVYEPNIPPAAPPPPPSPPLPPRTSTWGQAPIPKKSNTAVILLSVFLGLAIIGAGILGFLYVDANNTIDAHNQTISGLNSDKSNLQSQLSDSESELTTAENDIQNLNDQLSIKQTQLTATESQLEAIQAKYPLKNFLSLFQLQAWANNHVQTYSQTISGWYAGALQVQEAAANDGYYVSACLEEYSSGSFFVSMQAMVGTTLYWWDSEVGTVNLYYTGIN